MRLLVIIITLLRTYVAHLGTGQVTLLPSLQTDDDDESPGMRKDHPQLSRAHLSQRGFSEFRQICSVDSINRLRYPKGFAALQGSKAKTCFGSTGFPNSTALPPLFESDGISSLSSICLPMIH